MTRNPVWVQQDYQFYADDGAQGAATPLAAINTGASALPNVKFRCRINWGDTNNATTGNVTAPKLQFQIGAGAWADVGAATSVRFATSAVVADGNNDPTERLANIIGSIFTSAWQEFDSNNVLASRTWADNYTEYEFCLLHTGLTAGNEIHLRVVTGAGAVPTITNIPTITVLAGNVNATLVATDGADLAALNADIEIEAQLAAVDGADLIAFNIQIQNVVTATLQAVDGADILSAFIEITTSIPNTDATLTGVDGADLAEFSIQIQDNTTAILQVVDGADLAALTMQLPINASLQAIDGADLLSASVLITDPPVARIVPPMTGVVITVV